MRIAFFGNHTVGVHTFETLTATEEVALVVAHPVDPEDGVRYESVFEAARSRGIHAVRCAGGDPKLPSLVRSVAPDLLWVTDYRYLLPREVRDATALGAVNLHPSLLPRYRGRAPLNWAILHGEKQLGLTAHFVDEGMDTGDIIEQLEYSLGEDEDVGDALHKLYPLYRRITARVLRHFREGSVPRHAQDHGFATVFSRRRPGDGRIDWSRPAADILNLIRAVAAPYPGAFTDFCGTPLTLWKALRVPVPASERGAPGTIVEAGRGTADVACGGGILRIVHAEPIRLFHSLHAGVRLGTGQ